MSHVELRDVFDLTKSVIKFGDGRPDMVWDLTDPARREAWFTEEGEVYEGQVQNESLYFVVKEALKNLTRTVSTYSHGIRVQKDTDVMGDYAPRDEPYEYKLPQNTIPSGMGAKLAGRLKVVTSYTAEVAGRTSQKGVFGLRTSNVITLLQREFLFRIVPMPAPAATTAAPAGSSAVPARVG
eukprot:jgi/Mesvir1/3453/Mv11945-RA.1